MQPLLLLFILALCAETGVRLWLAGRQIRAVRDRRSRVPALFADAISVADQERASDYTLTRARFGRGVIACNALLKLALTAGGGVALADAVARRLGWAQPWQGLALVAIVGCVLWAIDIPFAAWRTFRIEARFGFNRTTPKLFVLDLSKQLLLGVAIGAPSLLALLVLMQRAGPVWWLYAFLLWLLVMLALTWAAPRFIAPLFNRFTPLESGELKQRVESLIARCGFAARGGVFVMDGSRRSAHGNAYFTGLGRNRRIVFFDTLLARIDAPEVEAVLAHELGHFRLHHVRQRLIVSAISSLLGLALLGWLSAQPGFYASFGIEHPSPAAALLLFALIVPVFTFFITPLNAWWSRRHEREADDFAVAYADPRHLAAALIKLYRDNSTPLMPDRVHSAFYDSHPPALERIERLRAL
ncbi:MAG TPA: M48 family metallopeptidase [Steroidobacteraceae bacterium]|nr:M48 family metallopeptidase [Steroidobacteraceae bacterium]